MAQMNVIAFDLGASNGRSILGRFDGEKISLQELNRFENSYVRVAESYYWDILRLFSNIKQGICEYSKASKEPLTSMGIDTWGVDFGLLDKAGRIIGNLQCYRDPRGLRGMRAFHQKYGGRTAFDQTGVANMEFNTLYQLYDMVQSGDPRLDIADKMLLMPDLLGYMLSGNASTEYTIASTTQMLDAVSRKWSNDVIEKAGIKNTLLTDIQMSGEAKGQLYKHIAEEAGLRKCPRIINVGSHDTASAVAAVPSRDDDYAFLSSGTWSIMGIVRDNAIINNRVYDNNFSNEGMVDGRARLLKNIMGLWIVQNCKKQWDKKNKMSWAQITDMAKSAPAFQSFIDINAHVFFEGENMPQKVQQYCRDTNQKIPQTEGEIARTIYESLAMSYRDTMTELEALKGSRIETVHIIGGGAQNELLNQMAANALDKPVVAGPIEATAIGNLMMQLKAAGEVKDIHEIRQVIERSFDVIAYDPKETDQWQENHEKYKKILAI